MKVCVRDIAKGDPTFADELKKKTYAKLGRDHPDTRAVRPCPVPLVVVGNKYDIFKVHPTSLPRAVRESNITAKSFCSIRRCLIMFTF